MGKGSGGDACIDDLEIVARSLLAPFRNPFSDPGDGSTMESRRPNRVPSLARAIQAGHFTAVQVISLQARRGQGARIKTCEALLMQTTRRKHASIVTS